MSPVPFRRQINISFRYRQEKVNRKKVLDYHGISLELADYHEPRRRVIFELRFSTWDVLPVLRYESPVPMYEGHKAEKTVRNKKEIVLYCGEAPEAIARQLLKLIDRHGYIYDTRPRSVSSDVWNDLQAYYTEVFKHGRT